MSNDPVATVRRRTVLVSSALTLAAAASSRGSASDSNGSGTDPTPVDEFSKCCSGSVEDAEPLDEVEYEEYERETPYSDLILLVNPDSDPDDDPEVLLEFLAWQATELGLAAFDTVPGTLEPRSELDGPCGIARHGRYQIGDGVCATLEHNTIGHEYVHTQQVHSRTFETQWLIEAVARFYQRLFSYRRGYTSFRPIVRDVDRAREHYPDAILADPSTWGSHQTYATPDYLKGSFVIFELDRLIRERTSGDVTFDAVFAEMNAQDIATHEEFLNAVEAATDHRFESFFDRYVFGTEFPDVPDVPEPFDRHYEFEFEDVMIHVPSQKTYDTHLTIGQIGTPHELIVTYELFDDTLDVLGPIPAGEISYRQRIELDRPRDIGSPPNTINIYTVDEDGDPDDQLDNTITFTDSGREIRVIDEPQPTFDIDPPVPRVGEEFRLDASESEPRFLLEGYDWEISSDEPVDTSEPVISHTVSDPGEYNVSLTVTDVEGVTETVTTTLTVSDEPSVADYAGDEGIVRSGGLLDATSDFRSDEIDSGVLLEVAAAFRTGEPVT
ncbi:hypothetical protein J2751_002702 [Halorubrum alkaliphilum]|uniref:PKD domain-containing protein n=1 Tax=Halorubrum alkaliphilum TaxID=261290 RepID=A0A8T4GIZ1_9EURY|nr:PKD domain-containing protein [Halorubrum alkaliphilum]MBP1923657.1 hypothetical protein [Halorubrum alkaliphilum]